GLLSTEHVLLAHIIPTRKCNLSCGYCNEYDDFSPPIPIETMLRRIDLLAGLKTAIVTISGGEPLLHPEIEKIIQRIRHHGMIAGMITNGYLLMPKKIQALNHTGALKPLTQREADVYREIKDLGTRSYSRFNWFQENLAQGKPNDWKCRAGGRYLYICEDGLVHYCSQQRGYPGIALEKYTFAD